MGLPIVSPGVALSSDIGAAGAGLVTDTTESALASAIVWTAEHPAALLEMGERAWQLAHRSLSWDTTDARLESLDGELAAGSRRESRRA